MTLKNISSGIRVANYKELCKLLEEPVKAGNSKKAQLKDEDDDEEIIDTSI